MPRGNPHTQRCPRCFDASPFGRRRYGEPVRTGRTRERSVSNGRRVGRHIETQHELICRDCGYGWWSHHTGAESLALIEGRQDGGAGT